VTRYAPGALAHAVEDAWCEAWASLERVAEEPRTIVERAADHIKVFTPGLEDSLLNIVLRYRASRRVTKDDVLAILAPFARLGLHPQWWLLRGSEPTGLREALYAVGMHSWGAAPAMALDLRGWQSTYASVESDLTCFLVTEHDDAMESLAVMTDVFHAPWMPMRRWTVANPAALTYAVRWRERIVSALTIIPTQGIAGVYNVATDDYARRRGIGGALVRFALEAARDQGLHLATLTSTADAQRLYQRLGFELCGEIEQWSPGAGIWRGDWSPDGE
jgi:ribosomal protein S18 acetylase RimI-like enzyme